MWSGGSVQCVKGLSPLLGILGIFCLASGVLYLLASALSHQIKAGSGPLSFPTSIEQLRSLSAALHQLKEEHFYGVLGLFAAAYLYKQTFAIPGSVFLNVLAGALFGVWFGLPLVCLLSALGASACYMLSRTFGKELVWKYLGHRIQPIQTRLQSDSGSLLFVLLSLRLFPMTPNWLLNMASPLVGVPLHLFFVSVLIGLLPYNFMCLEAGLVLSELQMVSVLDAGSVLTLVGATLMLLLTAYLLRKCRERVS